MQRLYVDLAEAPNTSPQPVRLGFFLGSTRLRDYLKEREEIGVNHIALNLRFNQADIEVTIKRLVDEFLSDFGKYVRDIWRNVFY